MCPSIVNLLGIYTIYPYLVSPEFGIWQQLEQVVACSLALCAPGIGQICFEISVFDCNCEVKPYYILLIGLSIIHHTQVNQHQCFNR